MRMEARPSETSGVRGLNKTYLWAAWPAIGLDSRLVRAEGRTVWNSGTPCFNTCVHIQYFKLLIILLIYLAIIFRECNRVTSLKRVLFSDRNILWWTWQPCRRRRAPLSTLMPSSPFYYVTSLVSQSVQFVARSVNKGECEHHVAKQRELTS